MRIFFALLLAFTGLTLGAQEIKKPKTELPENGIATFKLHLRSIPTIRVKINNKDLVLGVDTGCQGTGVLTPQGALRCGVQEAFSTPSMGNSGRSETVFGYIREMSAGGAKWKDFHISIMPLDGMNLDGLVGADILFEHAFYMDLSNRVMILGKTPDTSSAHEISCYSRGGHCGVNLDVEGQKVPMIVDSGASKSYMSSLKFKGDTTFLGFLPVASVRGVGLTRVEVCNIKSLRLGGAPLGGVEFIRDKEHNLLGDDFLMAHPIAVDMPSRRLWLFESQKSETPSPSSKSPDAKTK